MKESRWERKQERRRREGKTKRKFGRLTGLLRFRVIDEDQGKLAGKVQGAQVYVFREPTSGDDYKWTAEITKRSLPSNLSLAPETRVTKLKKLVAGEDILTEDDEFDRQVLIGGDEVTAVALLDEGSRRRVRHLIGLGFSMRDGVIRIEQTSDERHKEPKMLASAIQTAAVLAKRFSLSRRDLNTRLLHNLREERFESRLRTFEVLAKHRPRLLPKVDQDVFLRQLDAAVAGLELDEKTVDRVLAAVKLLEPKMLESFREPFLLLLLERSELKDIKDRIIEILAETGTTQSIPALMAHTSGLLTPKARKEAAKRAVLAIEERSGGGRGQLALTSAGGGLSPVQNSGELSLRRPSEAPDA